MFRFLSVISLACLVPLCALAQRGSNFPTMRSTVCELQIHVSYEDDHPVGRMMQVDLLNTNGGTSGQTFTDDRGYASFQVSAGNYRVRVTGPDVTETTSSYFTVNEREMTHMEYINVHRTQSASNAPSGPGGTVAVADLNVPGAALKEFKKGNEAMQKNDLDEARKHFDKAIQIYPSYAGAYFGEGMLEYKVNNKQKAREDWEKTTTLNDHFVPAYFMLARMSVMDNDFKRADGLLSKASTADPLNPEGLLLTAQVDLLLNNFDGAIEKAKKLHSEEHGKYAVVHVIAAHAYLSKNMPGPAVTEYKQFLDEAPPADPRVPKVREELTALLKSQDQPQQQAGDPQAQPQQAPTLGDPKGPQEQNH